MTQRTTTIKMPPKLKARVAALAKKSGRSAHQLILEAIERHAEHKKRMQSFVKEELAAGADIDKGGQVFRAEDVHHWIDRLGNGQKAARPKPRRE